MDRPIYAVAAGPRTPPLRTCSCGRPHLRDVVLGQNEPKSSAVQTRGGPIGPIPDDHCVVWRKADIQVLRCTTLSDTNHDRARYRRSGQSVRRDAHVCRGGAAPGAGLVAVTTKSPAAEKAAAGNVNRKVDGLDETIF